MKTPIPKAQHFVSKLLLEHFTNESGKIFFFSKRSADKGVLATTPEKLFRQNHIYTATHPDGRIDVRLERYYGALENLAAPVIEKIVTRARAADVPNLTERERGIWDVFFCNQWKRVPDFHGTILADKDLESKVRARVERISPGQPAFTPETLRLLGDPRSRRRVLQNVMVGSLSRNSPEILRILAGKGLCVAVIRKPRKSFVIGSFPIVKLNLPGRELLSDPSTQAWLPIAHDVAVSPAPIPTREEALCIAPDDFVREVNVAALKHSTSIAGKSEKLIESIAHRR